MKTANFIIIFAALLFAAPIVSAQLVLPQQTPQEGGLSQSCQEIGAHDPKMLLLSKLCDFSQTYLQKLPDFICQQTTTEKRDSLNIVSNAEVTFLKGAEVYSHVTMNGKPLGDAGLAANNFMAFHSDGEFGLFLANLFKPPIVAKFRLARNSNLDGSPAAVYDFDVPAKNSFWEVRNGQGQGRVLSPEVRGQIWLQRGTGRLLKLVLQPADLPGSSDATWIHTSIEYAPTSLGDAGVFVLPVRSETTVCGWWENSQCPKHVMTFHDCHKFAATTRVVAEAPEP